MQFDCYTKKYWRRSILSGLMSWKQLMNKKRDFVRIKNHFLLHSGGNPFSIPCDATKQVSMVNAILLTLIVREKCTGFIQ